MRGVLAARRRMAARADLCVIPSAMRAELFQRAHPTARVMTVWNCPARREVSPAAAAARSRTARALSRDNRSSPAAVVDHRCAGAAAGGSAAGRRRLRNAWARRISRRAQEPGGGPGGIANRFEFAGTLSRDALMRHCATCDVGLGFLPRTRPTPTSARWWAPRTRSSTTWLPASPCSCRTRRIGRPRMSIAASASPATPSPSTAWSPALSWMLTHPAERRAMGERGRRQVLEEWNYEQAFAPVMAHLGVSDRAAAAEGALSW